MKLTTKLVLLFLLLTLVPLVIVGYVAYNNSREAIEQNTFSRLVSNTILKKDEFNRWLDTSGRRLQQFANRPAVQDIAQVLTEQEPTNPAYQVAYDDLHQNHFASFLDDAFEFLEVSLLNSNNGFVLASSDSKFEGTYRQNEPYFIEGQKDTYIDHVRYSLSLEQAAMYVSAPIKTESGDVIAVLAGRLNLSIISEIMEQESGLNPTEKSYLVNNFNFFVTNPKLSNGDFALKKAVYTDGVNACLAGNTGVKTYNDYRNVPVMGAYRWAPERQLCILTEVDQAEAFAPINNLRNHLLGIGSLIAAMVAMLGVVFARSITGPVKELVAGTEAVGRGNLDYRIKVGNSRDEIGNLATAFNQMTARRQQDEAMLHEQGAFLQNIFRGVATPIFVVDVTEDNDFRFAALNPAHERVSGMKSAEVQGMSPLDLPFPPEITAALRANYARCLEAGEMIAYEEMIPVENRETWWLTQLSPLQNAEGRIYRIVGSALDITRRKQIEDKLRQAHTQLEQRVAERTAELQKSEKKYRDLVDHAPVGVYQTTIKGEILYVNNTFARLLDFDSAEEMRQSDTWARYKKREAREKFIQQLQTDGIVTNFEAELLASNNRPVHVLISGVLSDHFISGMVIDISERKQAEQALQESERTLSTLMSNLPGMAFRCRNDIHWTMEFVSEGCIDLTGYQPEDLINNQIVSYADLIHPEDRAQVWNQVQAALQQKRAFQLSYRLITANKAQKWMSENGRGIFAEDERLLALEGFITDETERKQAEQELAQYAAELVRSNEELQQFAYVASHDLQEPLRMVTSYLQLLVRRYSDKLDGDAQEFIDFAVDGANRMKTLIGDLLAYSRVGTHGKSFEPTDCEAVLEQALDNLELTIADNQAVITHNPLPTVLADASQLLQLFQNLIGNALKYRSKESPRIDIGIEQRGGFWHFSVSDNGIGIEPEFFEQIFVIFQRLHNREEYSGTGIGLAVCKKIVKRHGGRIWVESQLGQGSTFYFTIPSRSNF